MSLNIVVGLSGVGKSTVLEEAMLLADQDYDVEHRDVMLDSPIGELGIYKVPIKLASGIFADIRVWVVAM